MKTCPNCHWTTSNDNLNFCKNCGTRLEDAPSAPAEPAEPAVTPVIPVASTDGAQARHAVGATRHASTTREAGPTEKASGSATEPPRPSATAGTTSSATPKTYGRENLHSAVADAGSTAVSDAFSGLGIGKSDYGPVSIKVDGQAVYVPGMVIARKNVSAVFPWKEQVHLSRWLILILVLGILLLFFARMDGGTAMAIILGILVAIGIIIWKFMNAEKSICLCLNSGDKVNIISKNEAALLKACPRLAGAIIKGGNYSVTLPNGRIGLDLK